MKKNTKKETNIRVWDEDRLLLKEMAKLDGRTLKGQFKTVINTFYNLKVSRKNKDEQPLQNHSKDNR